MPQVFVNNRATGTVTNPQLKRRRVRISGKLPAILSNPVNRKQRRAAVKVSRKGERTNGKTVD